MAHTVRPATPEAALAALLDGNQRFVTDRPAHPNQDAAHRRSSAVIGQRPFAVILGCSDSRVAAEIIFDQGLGDLFVVRTAGHLVGTDVLASVEFGVTVLGAPLVVVLGHDNCGAITAALTAHDTGALPPGFLRHIVERLGPEILTANIAGITERDAIGQRHVRHTADLLLQRSALLTNAVTSHHAAVVAMTYHLDNGRVHIVAHHGGDVPHHDARPGAPSPDTDHPPRRAGNTGPATEVAHQARAVPPARWRRPRRPATR